MKNKLFMLLSILLTVLLLTGILAHTVLAADGEPETQSETNETILGDVNNDGKVDIGDVVRLRQYFAEFDYDTLKAPFEIGAGADINGDQEINLADLVQLRRYLADIDIPEGPEGDGDTESTPETEEKCQHQNFTEWYYYDDGDDNTYELREARDCADCGEKLIETRKAASYGYFQKIEGNTSYGGSGMGVIDLSSKSVTANDEGKLYVQFFMALREGRFDTAVYKITGENGEPSEWIILSERGNGISGVDSGTQNSMTDKGLDGANTSLITYKNAIDLTDYDGQTVTVTLAVISKAAEDAGLGDKYVICATFKNVTVPDICFHENLSDWYYYDKDGTADIYEARDCADCGEVLVETRKAVYKGYFMSIKGEGESSITSDAVMNVDLANRSISPRSNVATLDVQLWLALGNGGFDNVYYKVTTTEGESEWLLLASRGSGISTADSGTQTNLTGQGYDGANMGVVRATLNLKDYSEQTVSVTFAAIPNGAAEIADKYLTFASFTSVVVPWVDTRPALGDIAYGANIGGKNSGNSNGGKVTIDTSNSGITVNDDCTVTIKGWCAVDGGISKYVWSVDGGVTWNDVIDTGDNVKDCSTSTASGGILATANAYSGNKFTNLEISYINASFNTPIDLSAYAKQTVSIIFAAVPLVNEDVKILLYTVNNIELPALATRESDAYFGASIKVNSGSAITPSTKNGAKTVTGATVDENCQINLNGWCAVDGGVSKYVWSVDGGITWNENFVNGDRIKTTTNEGIVTSGQSYSGKTFTDLDGAYTNAQFQSGGINIDLSAYAGSTVDIIFAAVPVTDTDAVIRLLDIQDVAVPAE